MVFSGMVVSTLCKGFGTHLEQTLQVHAMMHFDPARHHAEWQPLTMLSQLTLQVRYILFLSTLKINQLCIFAEGRVVEPFWIPSPQTALVNHCRHNQCHHSLSCYGIGHLYKGHVQLRTADWCFLSYSSWENLFLKFSGDSITNQTVSYLRFLTCNTTNMQHIPMVVLPIVASQAKVYVILANVQPFNNGDIILA